MLKFLIILFVIVYVTYRLGGVLMKALYATLGQDRNSRNFEGKSKTRTGGNVDIDYVPQDKKGAKKDFKGGEYVDYEELN